MAPKPSAPGKAACLAALAWCVFVLLLHGTYGVFACSADTATCAESRSEDGFYGGVLVDQQGQLVRNTALSVAFGSRNHGRIQDVVGGFATDAQGRYCVVWAQESATPSVTLRSQVLRFERPWQPLGAAQPPPGCQTSDRGVPWNRSKDDASSPQFIALPVVVALGVLLLLAALAFRATPSARRLRTAGLAFTYASTALFIALWFIWAA